MTYTPLRTSLQEGVYRLQLLIIIFESFINIAATLDLPSAVVVCLPLATVLIAVALLMIHLAECITTVKTVDKVQVLVYSKHCPGIA